MAVVFALGALVGAATLVGRASGFLRGYGLQITDALQPTAPTHRRLVVVAIDRRSLDGVEVRWPWPRGLHAELIRRLGGADVIVYDVLFAPPAPDDAELAEATGESRVVVSSVAEELEARPAERLLRASHITEPSLTLTRRAILGHSNVTPDPGDGVVRSLPLVVEDGAGRLVPSLSLTALTELDATREPLTIRPNSVIAGSRVIPTGQRAALEIAYSSELQAGAERAPIVSAIDVLSARVPAKTFQDKIVLIGVTDPTLGDDRPTPVAKGTEMSGVLIHANALNTMLTQHYLRAAGHTQTAVASGALGGAVALVTFTAPVVAGPIVVLVGIAGYVLWSFVRFDAGTVLDLLYPNLAMLLAFVGALALRYFTELRGRRRVSALFSLYVPKAVADELLVSGRVDEAVRGERLEVTAMFCDLRGFTAMSARLEPGQVRDLLNVFYDSTARIIHDHGGTLLAYVGDEVFAAWGAPVPDLRSAERAIECARALQDAAVEINERLSRRDLPPIAYGIGVHTGAVIAAHVGSVLRRQYTILGDTVNCASRLCTLAGRHEIVVSRDTYRTLGSQPPATSLPGIKLKGVGRDLVPHRLWPDELRDPTGVQREGKLEP